jgi:ubiquinone/menaquinone biosynthesis C-methylase UbiE
MVAEAIARTPASGLPVEFHVVDVCRLDFPENAFDGCRAERVLQHVADPAGAVVEMARVTRHGGRVVVFDPDWETLVIDPGARRVTRALMNVRTDRMRSGWIGRQFLGIFRRAGLHEVLVEPLACVVTDFAQAEVFWDLAAVSELAVEAGVVTQAAATQWLADLAAAGEAGTLFTAVTAFVVSGTKG